MRPLLVERAPNAPSLKANKKNHTLIILFVHLFTSLRVISAGGFAWWGAAQVSRVLVRSLQGTPEQEEPKAMSL